MEKKLYVRRDFDDHSRAITADHFKAICNAETNARQYLDAIHRTPDGRQQYAAFRRDRAQASEGNPDVSATDSYKNISSARITGRGEIEGYDGTSALEKILPKFPERSPFRSLLEPATGGIRDIRTGLHAELTSRPWEVPAVYRLTFPGTGVVDTHGAQWKANIRQFLGIGGVPKAYEDAAKLAEEIQRCIPKDARLELGGHSMGGGIASYVGLKLGLPATCLNAAMLGSACMNDLKNHGCLTTERLAKIQHVRVEGDPVTSPTVSKLLTLAANFLSPFALRRAPRLVGVIHEIRRESDLYPAGSAVQRHTTRGFELAYSKKAHVAPRPLAKNPIQPSAAEQVEFDALMAAVGTNHNT